MVEMRNFPFSFKEFTAHKFFIGERVTSPKMPKGEDPPYYRGGTIVGRFYAHPLYFHADYTGWVYVVLQTHYFFLDYGQRQKQPKSDDYCQLAFLYEDELESLDIYGADSEQEEPLINPQQLPLIFPNNPEIVGLLSACDKIYIESHGAKQEWIGSNPHNELHCIRFDVKSNDILMALIWSYQHIIKQQLRELNLPSLVGYRFRLGEHWNYFDFDDPNFETEEPQTLNIDFGRELEYTFTAPGTMIYSTPLPYLIVMENNDKQLIISRDICIQRAEQWQGILTAWSDARTVVYLMDADKLVYLDVKTLNPYRLNKSADILLGNSVDVNDSEIGDLRRHYCQQAIKSNQIVEYNYSHHWNDLDWNFVSRIVPVGPDNLIVTVSDPVGEEWQAQYFLKYQPSTK